MHFEVCDRCSGSGYIEVCFSCFECDGTGLVGREGDPEDYDEDEEAFQA